jgi:hypothetical protein
MKRWLYWRQCGLLEIRIQCGSTFAESREPSNMASAPSASDDRTYAQAALT